MNSERIQLPREVSLKKRKPVPFAFVLDALDGAGPVVRPMFGCHAVYVRGKIVLILRRKEAHPNDNGIWIATTRQHHESLRGDFPKMRSVSLLGNGVTGWQNIPASDEEFEALALKACECILRGDLRFGTVPQEKRPARGERERCGGRIRPGR